MSDLALLTFGCIVSFIAAAGGYLLVRQEYAPGESARAPSVRASETPS